MHVPDGFLDAATSLGTGAVAAIGVAAALRGSQRELSERTAPLAGLTAVFVFAAQMINFPVAGGTSGHLLGGALAAILVGPWTATLCLTVVLLVQAVLFADGGLTALGTNTVLMALIAVWVGWGMFQVARAVLPAKLAMVGPAAAIGALASVPAAALGFVGLYAIGGQVPLSLDTLLAAMTTWHVIIGIGESVITALVVSSIVAVRPDLVHGARPLLADRELIVGPGDAGIVPDGVNDAGQIDPVETKRAAS